MVNGSKKVDYDMKHHPMDDVLNPKAAKRRSVRIWASSNPSLIDVDLNDEKAPKPGDLGNPFSKPVQQDWEAFEPFDRRIYVAQKGAPLTSNTLPLTWRKVANMLVKERYFTEEQFNTRRGIEALKERYEMVRVCMRDMFEAPEEPSDEEGFQVRYAEGFEVYDLQPSATRCPGAPVILEEDAEMDNTSEGGEDVQDEGSATEVALNQSAVDDGPESDGTLPNESSFEESEIDDLHRDDVYKMLSDYFDDIHDDQAVSQPRTADIHLSDDPSVQAGLVGQVGQRDHDADEEQKASGVAEPTELEARTDRGMPIQKQYAGRY